MNALGLVVIIQSGNPLCLMLPIINIVYCYVSSYKRIFNYTTPKKIFYFVILCVLCVLVVNLLQLLQPLPPLPLAFGGPVGGAFLLGAVAGRGLIVICRVTGPGRP